jgi:protein-disulfide isomerase
MAWWVALFVLGNVHSASPQSRRPDLEQGSEKAPVTVVVFSDFQCAYCARLVPVLHRLKENNPDQVRIVFKNFPLDIHPQARLAHEAALVAAGRGKFWEMHDLLFANQSRMDRDTLIEHGRRVGVESAQLAEALDRRTHREIIEQDIRDGRDLGVVATPTMFVNGTKLVGVRSLETLQAAVDQHLGRPTAAETIAPAPRLDLSNAAFRGSPSATVTIVEFSDFQCPFCAKASPIVEQVLDRFPGKLRWAFKHFPLSFHPDAPLAHEAVLAAGEQGLFWEMHDAIFRQPMAIKRDDLVKLAGRLGLKIDRFVNDLDSRRFKAVVERDVSEGERAGVTGTPTFFINGMPIVGAVSADELARAIEAALSRVPVPGPTAGGR